MQGFPLADSTFGEFIEISVRDGGIGISKFGMAKLFQAFSQIDSGLSRKFEGTGLGLALVKQLAEQHGGAVAVASAEGEGACFVVWLPLRDAVLDPAVPREKVAKGEAKLPGEAKFPGEAKLPGKAKRPGEATRPGKATRPREATLPGEATLPAADQGITRVVLVVDDNPTSVEVIAAFLPAPAFKVVRSYGGEQAILAARQVKPDLILLDLIMPNVNGFDVVGALQGERETARIPILVLTARQATALDRETLERKAGRPIRIMEKAGFSRTKFLAEVNRALGST